MSGVDYNITHQVNFVVELSTINVREENYNFLLQYHK
jgi:hypothetical protein